MAAPRLFQLKAETASAPAGPRAIDFSYVRVRVDTGVFHLDQLYDYLVPEKFTASVNVGVRIQVPFGSKEVEGIVVERLPKSGVSGPIKFITKILSPHPVADVSSLRLIDEVALEYACNPWDLIRSAIPPRVALVDKKMSAIDSQIHAQHQLVDKMAHRYHKNLVSQFSQLVPFISAHRQVASLALTHLKDGSVLIVAPDENDVNAIMEELKDATVQALKLTSSMDRAQRYENFLLCLRHGKKIVVGTRSSIFAPVNDLQTVIVFKETSFDHYEIRSPGWNTRGVARTRARVENLNFITVGYCPSIETAFSIDEGGCSFQSSKAQVDTIAFDPDAGTLLPGKIFPEIRKALKTGPVLFLAARKGYGNALLCANCRNVALCSCGGRLQVGAKSKPPMCVHCGKNFIDWRCTFCSGGSQYLAGRGIERAAEEISRAFPGFPVVISAGDVIKNRIETKPSLILCTPGAQPTVENGYSAVVVLDAVRLFSHTDLRTQERAREIIFESSALVSAQGKVILIIDKVHPIVPAISRWNVVPLIKRELSERREINLPPYVESAVLIMSEKEATVISTGFRKAIKDARLPDSLQIFGPTPVAKNQSKIVIYCDRGDLDQLQMFLHELQKKRSIARKDLITMRLAPYSL